MIICAYCGRMVAIQDKADENVDQQRGAYIKHLVGHGVTQALAGVLAFRASLHSVQLPGVIRTHEDRWMKARLMWAENRTVADIAKEYDVAETAMRSRIQRWRKKHNWFPVRQEIVVNSPQ